MLARARSLQTFQDSITNTAENSKKNYQVVFSNFGKFCKERYQDRPMEEIIQEMSLEKNHDVILDVLQNWINWNDKLVYSSLRTYIIRFNSYLFYRGIRLDIRELKQLKYPKKIEEELHPISIDEIQKIMKAASYKRQSLYFAMLSSGMRPYEILNIKKKDIDTSLDRMMVKIPAKFTKQKRARTTFLSIEATKFLKLSKLKDDSYIWGTGSPNVVICEDEAFHRILKNTKMIERYESNNRYKLNLYSFRAFFITKGSRFDENVTKKFAGQKGYLLQYDRLTDKEKLELYKKIEPELLIFDTSKKDRRIKELEEQKTEVKLLRTEVEDMKQMLLDKGDPPFGYIIVDENDVPRKYQDANSTEWKDYPKKLTELEK